MVIGGLCLVAAIALTGAAQIWKDEQVESESRNFLLQHTFTVFKK